MNKPVVESALQPLSIGISDFSQLREYGGIYVDKTRLLYELAKPINRIFLTRPRRFGKTLLVSTFYSLFKYGLRDFVGLEIENLWKADKKYSVVWLDFSEEKYFKNSEDFEKKFNSYLIRYLRSHGFCNKPLSDDGIYEFSAWLDRQPNFSVVLLIDEYDAPLTACINELDTFYEVSKVLTSFYNKLKVHSRSLRFFFLTGIAKFSKSCIFPELNSLRDISLESKYGTILGFTREEILYYFEGYLKRAAFDLHITEKKVLEELAVNYNGYCFEVAARKKVFNPWSVLNFFNSPFNRFKNYWFNSGGQPSILLQYDKGPLLLEPSGYFEKQFLTVDELSLNNQSNEIDERVLLFQTGYLTIKESRNGSLRLGYPNREVANSMASIYLSCYLKEKNLAQIKAMDIPFFLAKGEVESFVKCVNSAFLALDYERCFITNIKECLSALLLVLQGSNLQAKTEVHNGLRRSTLEFTVENTHWVIELKFVRKKTEISRCLKEDSHRIKSRRCGEETLAKDRICLVMVFSEKKRQFVKYAYEKYKYLP